MSGGVRGGVVAAIGVAVIMFGWVAWHEFSYAHGHPYSYGPANVIGVAGLAGAIVAVCLLLVVVVASATSGTKDRYVAAAGVPGTERRVIHLVGEETWHALKHNHRHLAGGVLAVEFSELDDSTQAEILATLSQ